ncbi:MAG: hypothetical protein ACR2QK_17545, partial [Acidimicrobiales bacterium]
SDGDHLEFVDRLPHRRTRPRSGQDRRHGSHRLLVVDQPARHGRWTRGRWRNGRWNEGGWTFPGCDDRTSILVIAGEDDPLSPDADVITVADEATMSILGRDGQAPIDGATPVGFAQSMASELVAQLGAAAARTGTDG